MTAMNMTTELMYGDDVVVVVVVVVVSDVVVWQVRQNHVTLMRV